MKQISKHDQYKEKHKQKFSKDAKFQQEKPAKNIKLISLNTNNNLCQSQQSPQYLQPQPEICRQTISKNFSRNPPILPSSLHKNSSQTNVNLNLNSNLPIQNAISENPIKTPKFTQLKPSSSVSAIPQPYSYKFSPSKRSPPSSHMLQPQYMAQFQAKFQSRLKKYKQIEKGKGNERKLESSDILLDKYKYKDQGKDKDKDDQIRFLVDKNVKLLENNEKLIKENIQLRQQCTSLRQIIKTITKQIQQIQQSQNKQKTAMPSNLSLSHCSTQPPACPIPQQILSYISSLQSQLVLLHKIKQLLTQDIHKIRQQNLKLHNEYSRKIGDVLYLEDCLSKCQGQLREFREREREVREIGVKREMEIEMSREARERERDKDREMDRVMQKLEKYKEKVRKLNMEKEDMRREMELCKREIGDFADHYVRFFPQDSDG